jgi:hypothetical protein
MNSIYPNLNATRTASLSNITFPQPIANAVTSGKQQTGKVQKKYPSCIVYFWLLFILVCNLPSVKAQSSDSTTNIEVYKDFRTELMWLAKVKIAQGIHVGDSKRGARHVIPITGGTFEGPKIKGEVLQGGEDWQLVRPDGDTELNARYLLKTHDGYVIQVINNALIHMPSASEKKPPYIRSVIDLEAPNNCPYSYLNHAIFLGTLEVPQTKPGEEPYVIIGVYRLL